MDAEVVKDRPRKKIKLSELKAKYAKQIGIAYKMGQTLFNHPLFAGMQTNFDTSWDDYLAKAEQRWEIVDDSREEAIRLMADHLTIDEAKEVVEFIDYLKSGGLKELQYNRQEIKNNIKEIQQSAICPDCNNEGGRRIGMACGKCGKIRDV